MATNIVKSDWTGIFWRATHAITQGGLRKGGNILRLSGRKMACVACDEQISQSRGHIQLILGPMFSGKTTELIRRMQRFQLANHPCLVIKYSKDDRYDKNGISTHDRRVISATSADELNHVRKIAYNYVVIGIDEGQFFPDVVEFCEDMANAGKTVIVAALDGTFQRKPFGNILNLVPLAESVVKLKAVCMICYKDAAFTRRLGSETEIELVGGTDKYMAVCRSCYNTSAGTLLSATPIRGGDVTSGRQLFSHHEAIPMQIAS